ncbi:MAG: hypothetical protein SangKO_010810 [Sandaracinaceae bacterium]
MIVVLEDQPERVAWLRELVGDWHEVRHAPTVTGFFDLLTAPPVLTILDHDLGGVPTGSRVPSAGADGLTGLDACERMPPLEWPVLVWSVNPVRAPLMVSTLRRRGVARGTWVRWAPFGTSECGALIGQALAWAAGRDGAR